MSTLNTAVNYFSKIYSIGRIISTYSPARIHENLILLALPALLTFILFFKLINIGFWNIDDHELISLHTSFSEKGFSISTFFKEYFSSEVGFYLQHSRFRPGYYFFRILAVALFGINPFPYIAVNALTFYLGLVIFGFTLRRFFPVVTVCLAILAVASLPFNADMWPRLGPSERGAFLFTMLFLFSLSRIDTAKWAWPLCCIAATLAMSYKENFILYIAPLSIAFLYTSYKTKKYIKTCLWFVAPVIMAALLAILLVFMFTGKIGHIYAESTPGLLHILKTYTLSWRIIPFYAGISLLLIFFITQPRVRKDVLSLQNSWSLSFLIFLCTWAIATGTFIFYKGTFELFTRYAFPYDFLVIIAILSAVYPYYSFKKESFIKISSVTLFPCLLIILLLLSAQYVRAYRHASSVNAYNSWLSSVQGYDTLVIIATGTPISIYEPYFSLLRFSKSGLAPANILLLTNFMEDASDNLNMNLKETLLMHSYNGVVNFDAKTAFVKQKGDGILFTTLESSAAQRPMRDVLVQPRSKMADSIPLADMTLYIPLRKNINKLTLLGSFSPNDLASYSFALNNHALSAIPSANNDRITFAVETEMLTGSPISPQLHTLSITLKNNVASPRNILNGICVD